MASHEAFRKGAKKTRIFNTIRKIHRTSEVAKAELARRKKKKASKKAKK